MAKRKRPLPIDSWNWKNTVGHTSNVDPTKVSLQNQTRRMLRDSIYSTICGAMLSVGIDPKQHEAQIRMLASGGSTHLAETLTDWMLGK